MKNKILLLLAALFFSTSACIVQDKSSRMRSSARYSFPDSLFFLSSGGSQNVTVDLDGKSSLAINSPNWCYVFNINLITQAQWVAVVGRNPSLQRGDDLPVTNVSWYDVHEYIRKLNALTGKEYRLPTEAEWEFAARGGYKSKGYKYSGSNKVGDVAWFAGNSTLSHPVGSKKKNELGIYDMSGNVWEWCFDIYDANYYADSPQNDPAGPSTGPNRVYRGGSHGNSASHCRVSHRDSFVPETRNKFIGFRLVVSSE